MNNEEQVALIDWQTFTRTRDELGVNFVRILGYFKEDGPKSVTEIEEAMRAEDAARLVVPAHTLKGEARQFGAEKLADAAERIEMGARQCVEHHDTPDNLVELAAGLRALFEQTLDSLENAASPFARRTSSFGKRRPNMAAQRF